MEYNSASSVASLLSMTSRDFTGRLHGHVKDRDITKQRHMTACDSLAILVYIELCSYEQEGLHYQILNAYALSLNRL